MHVCLVLQRPLVAYIDKVSVNFREHESWEKRGPAMLHPKGATLRNYACSRRLVNIGAESAYTPQLQGFVWHTHGVAPAFVYINSRFPSCIVGQAGEFRELYSGLHNFI